MYCSICGTQLEENVQTCPNCNNLVVKEAVTVENVEKTAEENSATIPTPKENVEKKFSGKGIAGFVLSLVGILIAAIPCGVLGLIFSALGFNDTETKKLRGKGLYISGLVVSIVDIVIGIAYLA